MPKFSVDEFRSAMNNVDKIRNISIAAQVDAGKTTLTDSLMQRAGIISRADAGDKCSTDTMDIEQQKGITIKSMGVSLSFNDHLINVIDSPGHVDFSSEVTAAVRVTDGVVILIDAIDGVMVQTETVVRQSITDKTRPVLMINKMDRVIKELDQSPEEIYDLLVRDIGQVNALLSEFDDNSLGELEINPVNGNVCFGSAYHQWSFRLQDFEKYYAKVLNKTGKELYTFLWKRKNFVKYIMGPIKKMYNLVYEGDYERATKLMVKIGVTLPKLTEKQLKTPTTKMYIRHYMGSWLQAGDGVLNMVIDNLPSPKEAQPYRSPYLYTGSDIESQTDVLEAMKNCDPDGPLVMYVSKRIPDKSNTRFYAYGRVFSGTVKTGEKYTVLDGDYVPGESRSRVANTQQVCVCMAGKMESIGSVPAGNTCALMGYDGVIVKTATITDSADHYPMRDMKYSVAPVVRVAIAPKNLSDRAKFEAATTKLRMSDPLLLVYDDKTTGEKIIAGAGELHVEMSIYQLRHDFAKGIDIVEKEPVVNYGETIVNESEVMLAKSANKHNRLFVAAKPMNEDLVKAIEEGEVKMRTKDQKAQARIVAEKYDEDPGVWGSKRMLGFGPTENDGNILLDNSAGVSYMNESRMNIYGGFQDATAEGPLCGEQVRGVSFGISDAKFHSDSVHRGVGQVRPTSRRACHAAMMHGSIRLIEPILEATITVPMAYKGNVYPVISGRRGELVSEDTVEGSSMCKLKCYIPVKESFGFDNHLKSETSGRALPDTRFSHWAVINSDPLEEGTYANEVVKEIRKRKGMKAELPNPDDFKERL